MTCRQGDPRRTPCNPGSAGQHCNVQRPEVQARTRQHHPDVHEHTPEHGSPLHQTNICPPHLYTLWLHPGCRPSLCVGPGSCMISTQAWSTSSSIMAPPCCGCWMKLVSAANEISYSSRAAAPLPGPPCTSAVHTRSRAGASRSAVSRLGWLRGGKGNVRVKCAGQMCGQVKRQPVKQHSSSCSTPTADATPSVHRARARACLQCRKSHPVLIPLPTCPAGL